MPDTALEARDLKRLLDLQYDCAQAASLREFRERVVDGLAHHFGYRTTTFFTGPTLADIFTDASPVAQGTAAGMVPAYLEEFHRIDPFALLARSGGPAPAGPISLDALTRMLRPEHHLYLRRFLFRNRIHAKVVIPVAGGSLTGGVGLLDRESGAFDARDLERARLVGHYLTPLLDLFTGHRPATVLAGLTPRQADVVRLVAQGLRNDDIAAALHISRETVKKHLTAAYACTGCTNRVELARLWDHGPVSTPSRGYEEQGRQDGEPDPRP